MGWAEKGINSHKVHAQSLAVHAMQKRSHFEVARQITLTPTVTVTVTLTLTVTVTLT